MLVFEIPSSSRHETVGEALASWVQAWIGPCSMPIGRPHMVVRDRTHRPPQYVIEPALQKELHQHQGRWVAITRDRLLAVGESPTEVMLSAREQGVRRPMIYRVPGEQSTTFLL